MDNLILVTGSAGYIGSHCVADLLNNSYNVVILDNLSTGHIEIVKRLQNLKARGKVLDFIKADLKNKDEIKKAFKKYKFDAVIHFAANSLVCESVENPQKYYHNNIAGSLNLLDCMLEFGVKNIIFSSTCATYGVPNCDNIDENHPQKPVNPYGNTKLAIEFAIKDYSKAYNMNYVILRYFNVAGADKNLVTGEWHDVETHLIPNILKSALNEEKTFELFGDKYPTPDGTCIRDYIDVTDLARAHRFAYEYLKNGKKSAVINLGTEQGQSVKEIFGTCENVLNKKIPLNICPPRQGDPPKLVADNTKAKEILGWRSDIKLEETIKNAYNWELELTKIRGGK